MAYLLNQPYSPTNHEAPVPPDMLARHRQFGEAELQAGMDTSPIRSPWQGAARLAQALMGGLAVGKADKQEMGYRSDAMKSLVDAMNGRPAPDTSGNLGPENIGSSTPGMPAAAPAPSSPDMGKLMTAASNPYLSAGGAGLANAMLAHQFKMYDPITLKPDERVVTAGGATLVPMQGAGHWMTAEEKQGAGIPADQPLWVDATGKPAQGATTVNVGGEQADYGKAMAGAVAGRHVALASGVESSLEKARDIHAMQAALQRVQSMGGTTGLGQQEITNLQSAINTGAATLGMDQQFDISDKEFLNKFNRQLAGQAAKSNVGARVTNFELNNYLKSNPGLEMSPQGNFRLLGIMEQIEQRNIEVGTAIRDAAAAAIRDGRKPDPSAIEQIIRSYDDAHHIKDPMTGQDLTKDPTLPEYKSGAGGGATPVAPVVINGYTITPAGP